MSVFPQGSVVLTGAEREGWGRAVINLRVLALFSIFTWVLVPRVVYRDKNSSVCAIKISTLYYMYIYLKKSEKQLITIIFSSWVR